MGILAMLAGLSLLIIVHEFGHWAVAQWRGMQTPVFSIGFGSPYLVLGHWRGTEFRLSPWLLGGYVAVPELNDETTGAEYMKENGLDPSQIKQFKIWERAAVAVAGVTMNVLTAIVLTFLLFALVGTPDYQDRDTYVYDLSTSNTIARDAGLEKGDIVLSVDGQPVKSPGELIKLITAHKATPAVLVVQRGSRQLSITVTPNKDGMIGIALGAHVERHFRKVSVATATVETVKFQSDMVVLMVKGLGMMLHLVQSPPGLPAGATDLHGIVAIVQFGNYAYQQGLYSFVMMLALFSMNLAFFNILPIPVLDGGYLLFYAIEAVRGKPLGKEVQQKILTLFIMLLLAVFALAIMNDFVHPVQLPK